MSQLGRFLELSVRSTDLLESLAFYKALGFCELTIGDAWSHRYAVVSDGELCIGLHDREHESPALTFVHPDVAQHARGMIDHGFELAYLHVDGDEFNRLGFTDPDGHMITIQEARTFSPPVDELDHSLCGEWFEITLPVKDATHTGRFWAPLAPVLLRMREEPTLHMRFDAAGVALGLSESIALAAPSLCFKCHDREALLAAIERHGMRHKPFPGFEGAFVEIVAPEGTRLYAFDQDFLGEPYIVEESGVYEAGDAFDP